MKDLEEYCKQQQGDMKLFVEKRENQYRNESIERTRIIKPSELMKAVAAMYLFQPHRAARDFRGIRTDYNDEIFLAKHSVIPYHLAGVASYKFEFCVRNRRLDREKRIFKYYVLGAIGFQICGAKNIFRLKRSKQKEFYNLIEKLLRDEGEFVNFCERTSNIVEEVIDAKYDESPSMSRERLRDALRSESFSKEFFNRLSANGS